MFSTPEERWERLAQGLMWTGVIFVVLFVYGVYDGNTPVGLLMAISPAAIAFGLWQVVSMRLDALVRGDNGGMRRKVLAGGLIALGIGTLIVLTALHK